MKILMENWRKFLIEGTDLLQSQNGNIVIFADWAKGHIEQGHKESGQGSIFAEFDLSQIGDALSQINVEGSGGVYKLKSPGVGYDLVLPMAEAIKLPGAKKVTVQKEERGAPVNDPDDAHLSPYGKKLKSLRQASIGPRPTTMSAKTKKPEKEELPDDHKSRYRLGPAGMGIKLEEENEDTEE